MFKSRTPKQKQERTPYDRTKRGIVMIVRTRAFAFWTIDRIRAHMHEVMTTTAAERGVIVSLEPDYPLQRSASDTHNVVIVAYAVDEDVDEVEQLAACLNVKLGHFAWRPGKKLSGKLLGADAFRDEPIIHERDPELIATVGLVLMARDNAERRDEAQSVQS